MDNNFQKSLEQFGGLGPGVFQFSSLLQLLNNQLSEDSSVSFFFYKVNNRHLEMVIVSY